MQTSSQGLSFERIQGTSFGDLIPLSERFRPSEDVINAIETECPFRSGSHSALSKQNQRKQVLGRTSLWRTLLEMNQFFF